MEEKEVGSKNKITMFFKDMVTEFGKVTWPHRRELVESTWVVCVVICLLGLFVLACDQVLSRVLDFLLQHVAR